MRNTWDPKRRVVVTGLGVVSSLGIGWPEFWKNLLAGKSGISPITSFDTTGYDRKMAGEVKNFDPAKFMSKRKAATIGRSSQMAIAATKLALEDAGLNMDSGLAKRTGVCIGMTMAEMGILEGYNDASISKFSGRELQKSFSLYPADSVSRNVALQFDIKGPNTIFSTACAAGNYSLGRGYDLIKSGETDVAVVGGSDRFSRIVYTGFSRLYAIAPEKCQPFDKNRKGMIPGEGAGILVLETLEHAQKRKAKIYAEILGYGMSCDAKHMTNPSTDRVVKGILNALKNSSISADEVDYISAHGTGTMENDKAESEAIAQIFNGRTEAVPVSSIKSMLGHTMGAASALEAITCCLVIKDGALPPTINFETKDSECGIDCVPNKGRKKDAKVVLNNSLAFGGNNACLLLSKVRW